MALRVKTKLAGRDVRDDLALSTLETYDSDDRDRILGSFSLQDVYNAAAEDPRGPLPKVAKRHNIPLEVMETGLAWMISQMPALYAKIAGPPGTDKKLLIDNNLPPSLAIRLWRDFGAATHPKFHGIGAMKDSELWKWALDKKIDGIITRDVRMVDEGRDLGLIALRHTFDHFHSRDAQPGQPYRMNGAPVLVSFKAQSDKPIWGWMREHQNEIHTGLRRRSSPIVFINENGAFGNPTCRALARNDWDTVKAMLKTPVPA